MNNTFTATEIFKDDNYLSYDVDMLIEILTKADDMYFNEEGNSFLEDHQYDSLYRYTEAMSPTHVYFTGVGSDIRGGKVRLPFTMGSLDQVYDGEIEDWVKKHNLSDEYIIVTDKLDGTSGMVVYNEFGDLQISYSRGNGTFGADITRHVRKLRSVPKSAKPGITIRGEVIMEVSSFKFLQSHIKTRAGRPYKNPRNMVAGLMNSKEIKDNAEDFIKFIAYEIVGDSGSKEEQLIELQNMGFEVPFSMAVRGSKLNDGELSDHIKLRKQNSVYEIDGVVLDVNKDEKRKAMVPTRDTINPLYAVKYKIVGEVVTAKVVEVEWNISKHGYLKPRINIEPVELGGVTISYCTGYNAKYIYDNNIGPGAEVDIIRAGDVIPLCIRVVKPAVPQMPGSHNPSQIDWNWDWNESGVDAILLDVGGNHEVAVKRMIDFFNKIEVPMLKEGNIQKLYDIGYNNIESIIMASNAELIRVLGENGNKVFNGLKEKLNNMPLYKIIGAYSNERGIGVRRMKKLQSALGVELVKCDDVSLIANTKGFDTRTAEQTVKVIREFNKFFANVSDFITISEESSVGTTFANEKVCMTGFRDKELAAAVEAQGGTIQSSVSGKTTLVVCKDPNSNSDKIKKARQNGILVIGIDELKERLNV